MMDYLTNVTDLLFLEHVTHAQYSLGKGVQVILGQSSVDTNDRQRSLINTNVKH